MKFKNFTHLLMVILLISSSCTQKSDGFKVGFLHPCNTRTRFVKDGQQIVKHLRRMGVETIMADAQDDDALQIEKGYELIESGIDLLIIVPVNGNTIAPLIRKCKQKDIKVIAYNRQINNVDYDMLVTGDNNQFAKILCETTLKLKPRGNYVILGGDRFDKNGFELKQGIDSILSPHVKKGDINIIYESYIEGWKKENGMYELAQVMNAYPNQLDAIIACNGSLENGALEILKKYGMAGKVVITSQDAELKSLKNIHNNLSHVTIYHPAHVLGKKVAEVAYELLKGGDPNTIKNANSYNGKSYIPTFKVKSIAITKDNMEEVVKKNGLFSMTEIAGISSEELGLVN